MSSKLHFLRTFAVAVFIVFVGLWAAQAQTPTPAQPAPTATLHGHIADPSGALIPGAKVTIANALGVAQKTTTSDASGSYSATGLEAGSYIVEANVEGFAPFSSPTIKLEAGQSKRVDISMAIEVAQQSVTVTEDTPQVNIDASGNASAAAISQPRARLT